MDRIDNWLNTARNQKYTHMISIRFIDEKRTQASIFCKSLEERKEKAAKINETGMVMGNIPAYVCGVYACGA